MKLQKGDEIIVTRGKDHGKHGTIESVSTKENTVLVPGVNIYKKHVKAQGQAKPGGIVDMVRPLRIANVALICPKCGKPTRVGYAMNGEKKRICRKCKKEI